MLLRDQASRLRRRRGAAARLSLSTQSRLRLCTGQRCAEGVEEHTRSGRGVVGDNRVVDDLWNQSIFKRDTAAVPSRDVVDDDVIRHQRRVPLRRRRQEVGEFRSVDTLQPQSTAAAGFCRIALDQVGVDDQVRSNTIAQSGRAIRVRRQSANRIGVGCSLDDDAAAIGRNRRVQALVEDHRVVLDVAVVAEAEVRKSTTVTGAHVAADPVVVELVVVSAAAEAHAAGTSRCCGEQFVANRQIARHVVVVHVDVEIEAVRLLHIVREVVHA